MLEESIASCRGAIFDFDGTLFATERVIEECWEQVSSEEGKFFSHELFLQGGGVKDFFFIRDVLKWSSDEKEIERLKKRKEDLYVQRLQNEDLHPIPWVVKILFALRDKHIPCAIGSSSLRKNIDLILSRHEEVRRVFSVIVSGEDVSQGKPDPEVFLLAASCLCVEPHQCVVFEDTPLGILAGRRAGMKVIGVATTRSVQELEKAGPDAVASSFLDFFG